MQIPKLIPIELEYHTRTLISANIYSILIEEEKVSSVG